LGRNPQGGCNGLNTEPVDRWRRHFSVRYHNIKGWNLRGRNSILLAAKMLNRVA